MDAVILVDTETGMIVDCNPAASLLLGMDNSELVGQNYSTICPKSIRKAGHMDLLDFAAKHCPTEPFETEIRTKSGENKYVSIQISFFDLQGKRMIHGTFRDVTKNKMMQQTLLENEEKFHGIASSVKDAIVLVNNEAKVTYWNPAAEKMFGYSASEVIGKNIHKLVVPNATRKEVKDCIDLSVKAFTETGTGYFTVGSVELIGRRKDDTEFPAELAISPIKLGGRWHAVGVVKNITNRKKVQEKIREAEQRYHALFDEAPLGVLVIDPETAAFVEFNDVAYLQLGYSNEEFGKLTICDIEAKETSSEVKSHISEMLRTGGGEFETQHRTKNGEIRNVLVTTRTIELPDKTLLHAIFHDITEIRKGQNALIESEARYRQLVEIAQAGIWAINKDFSTIFVNPRMAEMLGYTETELIGKNLFEFIDKDMAERLRKILEQFNQPSVKGQFDYSFPRKDGTYINASLAISTITDDRGQAIGELALVADITERKRLEDELRASEERFRAISASAMDAIILVDEEDKVMYWNPAAEGIFGFGEKEVIGEKLDRIILHPQTQTSHNEKMQELMSNPFSNRHLELTAMHKDGRIFPIDLSVAPVKLKDKNCFLAFIKDVSERKEMEEALKQERDMLEAITANITATLMLINKDYQVMWINKFGKEVCGDMTGQKCYSALHDAESPCLNCGVKRVFEGAPSDVREQTVIKDNKTTLAKITSTPMRDKNGNIVGVLELGIDITEIKKMQGELARYSQKLEELVEQRTKQLKQTQAKLVKSERLAAIGELAGMVGHDLRNPLTGIKNSAYFLRKKGSSIPEAQAKEMLETIDKCVNYSNKIVSDLLDYSREIHLELNESTPRRLIAEALEMITVPERIEVLNLLPDEPLMKVDTDKIKRVFINIVKNAIEAMSNVGKLTIEGKEVNCNFEMSFIDTGPGISDKVLPNLFSPLFTTKAQGMGFGLAICKRIIEAHGGTITVKTATGEGTTFKITLPIEHKNEIGGEKIWINMPESSLSTTMKQ
jgi:PAS domain S-box-containing protein